ncbi:MAG: hypothetical protein A2X49_09595 [Lentisphaerae bacterium GWF2_52_8]|nr:MAG: hypothetical protein A2X49_09595 [Lentisphaerae bacterium GWF2_52_8]
MNGSAMTQQPGGITMRLKETISGLLDSSRELRQAIICRDLCAVTRLINYQGERAAELEQFSYLWKQVFAGVPQGQDFGTARSEIRSLAQQLQTEGRINTLLIRNFLTVIRRAMTHGVNGMNPAQKTQVYGKHGKLQFKQSSLLLKREG